MTSYGNTKAVLQKNKLAPSKRFGQNFLVHKQTAEAIVHAGKITAEDIIVEVGVGLGALTGPLSHRAQEVIGVEIDKGIITYHQEENILADNVTLIHDDVLKLDFSKLRKQCQSPLKIMANLPYSISNPFIFKLIENRDDVEWATIMLQKEVADRLMATPGTKQYGAPSVLLQACASIERLMTLKPSEFHPRPKVDSVVIRILFSPLPKRLQNLPNYDDKIFTAIVRSTFGNRRKTLLNTMKNANLFSNIAQDNKPLLKTLTEDVIRAASLSPNIRGEQLSLEDFVELAIQTDKLLKSTL